MAYDTLLNVPRITGKPANIKLLGDALFLGETQTVRVLASMDSRWTWPGGAGREGVDALSLALSGISSHGNMPESPLIGTPTTGSAGYAGYVSYGQNGVAITGRATTVANCWPSLQPDVITAIADGVNGTGTNRITGATSICMFRLDPERRNAAPAGRANNVGSWSRANQMRARFFLCSNATSTSGINISLRGIPYAAGVDANFVGTILGESNIATPELISGTYDVFSYATPFANIDAHEMFNGRIVATGGGNGVEVGLGRFESSDTRGICLVHAAQGSAGVFHLASLHPDSKPWYDAIGPFHVGIIGCNVNDSGTYATEPPAWETAVRQAITDLRTFASNPTMPVIIWIQMKSIGAVSTAGLATTARFSEYAGVAKTIAEDMDGVVAINTAREILEKWHDPNKNWVPNGAWWSLWNASGTYALNDIIFYSTTSKGYRVLAATAAGEDPVDTPAKFKSLQEPWSAATVHVNGDVVLYGGSFWAFEALDAAAAGQEPGSHKNWTKLVPFPPGDSVHPIPEGHWLYASLFAKALADIAGYAGGYTGGFATGTTEGYTDGYSDGFAAGEASGGGGGEPELEVTVGHLASIAGISGAGDYIGFTPNLDVPAGSIIRVGNFIAIATSTIHAGEAGNAKRGGVDWFDQDPVAKAVGDVVYLSAADTYQKATKIVTANLKLGVVAKASLDTDRRVLVIWNG